MIKEIKFFEQTLRKSGRSMQFAKLKLGTGKKAFEINIRYDRRESTDEGFTLWMGSKLVAEHPYSGFDFVTGRIEKELVIFYTPATGFNEASKPYIRWEAEVI